MTRSQRTVEDLNHELREEAREMRRMLDEIRFERATERRQRRRHLRLIEGRARVKRYPFDTRPISRGAG